MALSVHHIITVTAGGILYRDSDDIVQWLDFKACNRNWIKWLQLLQRPLEEADANRVGRHNTEKAIWLDVEFWDEARTRFEFRSYALRDGTLFEPMQNNGGWITQDARSTDS